MSKGKCEPIPEMVGNVIMKTYQNLGRVAQVVPETNLQPYIYNTEKKKKKNK